MRDNECTFSLSLHVLLLVCHRLQLPTGRGPMPKPILLNRPIDMGIVTDWDDMEEIWRHGIEDVMGLDAVEHPVLMADSTATPSGAR